MPGFHTGRAPVTKGRSLPPDPPSVEDIVALLEQCKPLRAGRKAELSAMRLRALVIVLWRTGLRISEALALEERDLNRAELAVTVRRGKGGKRRISAMDEWALADSQEGSSLRRHLLRLVRSHGRAGDQRQRRPPAAPAGREARHAAKAHASPLI